MIFKLSLLLILLPLVGIALAEESKPKHGWEFTGASGAAFTSGNSDSVAFSLQFLGTYRDEDEEASFGADYFFAEYENVTSTNSLNVFGRYNRNISKNFYLGGSGSIYTNQVADIDHRIDLSPALGYYVFRDEDRLLSVEVGAGYAWDSKDGNSEGFATYRAAQYFDYKLAEIATLRQSAVLTPKATDPSSYLFTLEAALDVRLHNRWNFRSAINHRIDLDPSPGRGKEDTILTFGLSYSLNGFLKDKEDRADERKTLKKKVEKKEGTRMGWIRNAATTVGLAQGNSDTLRFKFDYDSAFRSKTNEFFFKTGYQFGESNGSNTQNRINANIRYNWKFDPYLYAGIGSSFLHDDPADLKYRVTPGAHIGRYLILTDMGGFSLEGGLSYAYEERGDVSEGFLSLQAAQRLYWQIGDHTYITQEIAYDAPAEDPSLFNINSYLYLDTIFSERFSWRVGMEYYYNSSPASGAEKGDLSLNTGVAVRF